MIKDTCTLASDLSSQLNRLGTNISAKNVKAAIDTAKWAANGTCRVVKEQVVPAAVYIAGQLYKMFMGNSEVPQKAIYERKAEAVVINPQLTLAAESKEALKPEEAFFDAEYGTLDSDYQDALETLETPNIPAQAKAEKAEKAAKEITVAHEKVARAVTGKHAFGTHIPRPIRREKGMTDAEYRNKVESNLRAVEDPFKPKKTGRARISSRLEELAKPKVRNEDKYISHHQAELNWRKSLRESLRK